MAKTQLSKKVFGIHNAVWIGNSYRQWRGAGYLQRHDSQLLSRITLKKDVANVYETSVITRIYQSTKRCIPEKLNLH